MDAPAPTDAAQEVDAPRLPSSPVTIKLRQPIQFGQTMIEELTLKPNARAFKDFSLPADAKGKVDYQPYQLALVGLKLAGHMAAAPALVDKLDPKDMVELSQAVFSFFV